VAVWLPKSIYLVGGLAVGIRAMMRNWRSRLVQHSAFDGVEHRLQSSLL
jgi:hypothetical protein